MSKADYLKQMFGGRIAEAAALDVGGAPPGAGAGPAPGDRYAGVRRARNAGELEVERVLVDPQVRESMDEADLVRLTESVKSRGVLQPIRVRWDEARGAWVCVCGHRRLEAARRAGLARVPAVMVEGELTAADVLIDQLVENLCRSDLSPVEAGRGMKALQAAAGWTNRELAAHLGVSESAVSRAMSLLRLPGPIAQAVEDGKLSARAGAELARVEDPEAQRELAEEAVEHQLPPEQVAQRVRQKAAGGKPAAPAARKQETTYRAANGVRVLVTTARKHSAADVAEALREVADRLDRGRAAA